MCSISASCHHSCQWGIIDLHGDDVLHMSLFVKVWGKAHCFQQWHDAQLVMTWFWRWGRHKLNFFSCLKSRQDVWGELSFTDGVYSLQFVLSWKNTQAYDLRGDTKRGSENPRERLLNRLDRMRACLHREILGSTKVMTSPLFLWVINMINMTFQHRKKWRSACVTALDERSNDSGNSGIKGGEVSPSKVQWKGYD